MKDFHGTEREKAQSWYFLHSVMGMGMPFQIGGWLGF